MDIHSPQKMALDLPPHSTTRPDSLESENVNISAHLGCTIWNFQSKQTENDLLLVAYTVNII